MKERPILFSAPMARAILAGSKTQTRRVVKPFTPRIGAGAVPADLVVERDGFTHRCCPYGHPGDRLWVREAWGYRCGLGVNPTTEAVIEYRADDRRATLAVPPGKSGLPKQRPDMSNEQLLRWWESWRPSIHMPRWASRITLEVTGVRVERLQDISENDSRAEGCAPSWLDADDNDTVHVQRMPTYRQGFARLWHEINGAGSWNANPWVWVVEFNRIEQNHQIQKAFEEATAA